MIVHQGHAGTIALGLGTGTLEVRRGEAHVSPQYQLPWSGEKDLVHKGRGPLGAAAGPPQGETQVLLPAAHAVECEKMIRCLTVNIERQGRREEVVS